MSEVVTFGEIMIRLAPEGYYRLVQAENLKVSYGGSEANVAVSLANFGVDVAFVSKLPKHSIGSAAINSLRRYGVSTQKIVRGGEKVGLYYLEKGASQRASLVIYDRSNSSIQTAAIDDFEWAEIFDGAKWFHFSGITPALGNSVAEICMNACKKAKEMGLKISCDLNYRKNLWSKEDAGEVMGKFMKYVDVCIANEEDANDTFGIRPFDNDISGGQLNIEGYEYVAKELVDRYKFEKVAITLRSSSSASYNKWAAMIYDGKEYFFSEYDIHIVDRVGGGDSFGAGLIYSFINGYAPQKAINFAVAASCLKHSVEGDFNHVSLEEVNKLVNGDGSGRVNR